MPEGGFPRETGVKIALFELAERLEGLLGVSHVLRDPELRGPYEVDWTRRWRGEAAMVVRPASAAELAKAVSICADAGARIVIQGGNTGLVGGGVPLDGEVVISTTRMSWIGEIDVMLAQLSAGAGATLASVQQAASSSGFEAAIDLGARDSATLGGMVATNASGLSAVRFGRMSSRVVALEAVLADGTMISGTPGSRLGGHGYDLASLLIGSEGTLGIVTGVTLQLEQAPKGQVTALLALDAGGRGAGGARGVVREGELVTESAISTAGHLSSILRSQLRAVELFYRDGMDLVCDHARIPPPFQASHDAYLIIECAGVGDETAGEVAADIAGALSNCPLVVADAVATDAPTRARLWRYREGIPEAIASIGIPHKLDVYVPRMQMPGFIADLRSLARSVAPGWEVVVFGHVGVGNLHVNLLGVDVQSTAVDDVILELVIASGGSVSAEHGIGRAKAAWMPRVLSADQLGVMRILKRAMDPDALLNPGVMLPASDV